MYNVFASKIISESFLRFQCWRYSTYSQHIFQWSTLVFFKSEVQSTKPLNSQNCRGGPNEPHCQDGAVPGDRSSWTSIGWNGGRCFAHGKWKRAVMWEDDRCGSLPEIGPHSAPQLLWAPPCKGRESFSIFLVKHFTFSCKTFHFLKSMHFVSWTTSSANQNLPLKHNYKVWKFPTHFETVKCQVKARKKRQFLDGFG